MDPPEYRMRVGTVREGRSGPVLIAALKHEDTEVRGDVIGDFNGADVRRVAAGLVNQTNRQR